jgi:hypothetical protein
MLSALRSCSFVAVTAAEKEEKTGRAHGDERGPAAGRARE